MAGIVAALILLERRAQNAERESRRNRSLLFNKSIRDMCDPYRDPNFCRTYRLTPDIALAMVRELMPIWRVHARSSSLPAELKFLCALHFFGLGSYQRSLCNDTYYKISQSTSCRAISEVVEALNTEIILKKIINFPNTSQIGDIVLRNYERFGIPGVLGYIDGTHISLKKPTEHEELYVNRKGDHSLNVQMVCDSSLKILNVCAKYPGSTHDSFIWRFSAVRRRMMDINSQINICWLSGDSGYPLEPWLLTPILNAEQNTAEKRYTTAHIISRNSVERCFGVLKSRFRCLMRKLEYNPQKVGCIVNACAVLHNVCIAAGIPSPEMVLEADNYVPNIEGIRNREHYQRGLAVRQQLIERVFV